VNFASHQLFRPNKAIALPISTNHARSAVNISSLATAHSGEHRRQDTDGIRLEIEAPGCSVERSEIDGAGLLVAGAGEALTPVRRIDLSLPPD
jgi:hypothetical protein